MIQCIIFIILVSYTTIINALPTGFVYLHDIDPTIIQEMKYYSTDNFIGRRIKGYNAPKCILTYEAALALSGLQKQLKNKALGLKVYDCYRPTIAVNDLISWSSDIHDQHQKMKYYPSVNKADFFKLGYVAKKSSHSRGSTVDITLVHYDRNHKPVELNMGTIFDYMDETSHPLNKKMSLCAQKNRLFLRNAMLNTGFKPIDVEWWHFTLQNEPYLQTYFNFAVE